MRLARWHRVIATLIANWLPLVIRDPAASSRCVGRRSRWFARSAALSLLLVLSIYAIADAHATLLASEPAAGVTLSASPSRIRLLFSEPLEPTLATISIVDRTGKSTALTVSGDPHDVHAVVAPVQLNGTGEFRVVWHVISADGHPVGGSYLFAVGAPSAPPPVAATPPAAVTWGPALLGAPLVPAILRGLGVGFLMAAAGLLLFIVRFGADTQSRPMKSALIACVGAPLFLAAHLFAWLLNGSPTHQIDSAWLASMMASTVGRAELYRTLLSLLPLWALALARRPKLAMLFAFVALCASAAIGHSAAVHPAFAIPFKIVHLAGVALWLGGLVWLVARDGDDSSFLPQAMSVSSTALVAVLLVAISGIVQTLLLVPVRDLVSPYGAVVGGKILGLGVLIAFGAHHRYRTLPRLESRSADAALAAGFRMTLRREIAVMWLVILLGGFLAYVSPPHGGTSTAVHPESIE
jgi:copper transport protein